MNFACADFDVAHREDWEHCGRINGYGTLAAIIAVILVIVWIFADRGASRWGVAIVGLGVILCSAYTLPSHMAAAKVHEYDALHKQLDEVVTTGKAQREFAIDKIKTDMENKRLQSNSMIGTAGIAAFVISLGASLLGRNLM